MVTFFMLLSTVLGGASGQTLLVDDATYKANESDPGRYEFEKLFDNPVVAGVRFLGGDGYDIEINHDASSEDLIKSSGVHGNKVNFVVLEADSWTGPSILDVNVSTNSGEYIIEMENELDKHPVGISWIGSMNRPEGGPVINLGSPGSKDDEGISSPTVIFTKEQYHMWYTIDDGSMTSIGYATSIDGITWDKYPHPVLINTEEWEKIGVSDPSVIYKDNEFHMWYTGDDETTTAIGYATSPDGIYWNKNDLNPVLEVHGSTINGIGVSQPSVLYDDPNYHMWYSDFDGLIYRICYARSSNGIFWIRHENLVLNPVFDAEDSKDWDNHNVSDPSVIYDGSTFHMWYGGNYGKNNRIGYATSYNGINWTRYPKNPVLDVGPHGCWDDDHLTGHMVIQKDSTYHMWYSGHHGSNIRIGYATSKDMSSWTKYKSPPEVLDTYVVTNIIEGLSYDIGLDVPSTADLDMFIFSNSGGRNDALAFSTNKGAANDESITFTAPVSGDYILVVTNENGGTGMYTVLTKSPPVPNIIGNLKADEDGKVSFDAKARYPSLTEDSAQTPPECVDISGDGSYLAVGWANCISLFSTEYSVPIWTVDINEEIFELKLSDNGEYLVVLGERTVYFFHTSSGAPLWSSEAGFIAAMLPGNRLDMSMDGKIIAIKARGDRVLIFDTTGTTPMVPYWDYDFGDEVFTIKLSGDGNYLVMGGEHGHEFQLAWVPGRAINWTHTSDDVFFSASISYDGSTISFGQGNQHRVGVFDATSSTPIWTYELEGAQFEQAMSHNGKYFVSSNHNDGTTGSWNGFALWDTENSEPIWEYHTSDDIGFRADSVDMDHDAMYVVGGCRLKKVYLFSQLADGNDGWSKGDVDPIFIFNTDGVIWHNSVSISGNGKYFVAGSRDGTVHLFSTIGEPDLVRTWDPRNSIPASGNYSWDFDESMDSDGDGDYTNDGDFLGPDPTHVYEKSGNYTVTLTLKTDQGIHTYTMLVTVDIQKEPEGIVENILKPGLPLAGIAIMAALLMTVFAARTEIGKYRTIPLFFPLYSRLKKEEVLDHVIRVKIYEHITNNPGDHFNSIKNKLNLNNGVLTYHLKTMERENFIKSMRDGMYKRFYPVDQKVARVNGFGTESIQGKIVMHVMGNPGLTQREISKALSVSQQVVSYHLKIMQETGHVRVRRDGRTNRYFVNEWIPQHEM
jgi:predicted GH43/DUF377 family glycosyl hydrolase/DNA-binding MarR family transcriptional regulator